jgi:hypothetical protein
MHGACCMLHVARCTLYVARCTNLHVARAPVFLLTRLTFQRRPPAEHDRGRERRPGARGAAQMRRGGSGGARLAQLMSAPCIRSNCTDGWSPVLQTCCTHARARSRCRCGRGELSPGADVGGASPVPVQTWQRVRPSPGAAVRRLLADRWGRALVLQGHAQHAAPPYRATGCMRRRSPRTGGRADSRLLNPPTSAPTERLNVALRLATCTSCHICAGTGLAPRTSAPGLGSPHPHLRRDRGSPLPHLRRDRAHPPAARCSRPPCGAAPAP